MTECFNAAALMSWEMAEAPSVIYGTVENISPSVISAHMPLITYGALCAIYTRGGSELKAQVIGIRGETALLAPFGSPSSLHSGARVVSSCKEITIPVSKSFLGSVLPPLPDLTATTSDCHLLPIFRPPPSPSERTGITEVFETGIKSIDGLCTLGKGQRIGIFASAGVGKSTLITSIACNAHADVIVVALVGERGKEINEFVGDLSTHGTLNKAIIVAAPSDAPSCIRRVVPYSATTMAEYFRDLGMNVLLIVDSLTRVARAIRETGLAAGELPVRHGFPNSLFTELPGLLERPGRTRTGSITAIYTVLTNLESEPDPLADEVQSLLDGHIVLSKKFAQQGIYPAVDVSASISRSVNKLHSAETLEEIRKVRAAYARIKQDKEIVSLGGTADPELANILKYESMFTDFLSQPDGKRVTARESRGMVRELSKLL